MIDQPREDFSLVVGGRSSVVVIGTRASKLALAQAHMIRDFRRFAGAPPRAFMQSRGALSTALLEPARS